MSYLLREPDKSPGLYRYQRTNSERIESYQAYGLRGLYYFRYTNHNHLLIVTWGFPVLCCRIASKLGQFRFTCPITLVFRS